MHDDKRNDNSPNPWRDDSNPDNPWRDEPESNEAGRTSDRDHEDDLPSFSYRDDDEEPDPRERRSSEQADEDSLEAVDLWGEPLKESDDLSEELTTDDEREDWESDAFSDEASAENDDPDEGHEPREAGDESSVGAPLARPGEAAKGEEHWPLALIVVAVIALLLVTAGGYGVMQQRSAMQTAITELQARLAETTSPDEVLAARRALEDIQAENNDMRALVSSLREENQRLSDTLTGLEQQVEAQREATNKAREAAASTQQAESEAPESASTTGGNWFVNFGAYRERQLADDWAERLRDGGNTVVVMPIESNGRELYRVRITGLASDNAARQLASRLEQNLDLAPLWVGKQ